MDPSLGTPELITRPPSEWLPALLTGSLQVHARALLGSQISRVPAPFLHFLIVHSKKVWDEDWWLVERGKALCMLFQVSNKSQGAKELIRS